MQLSDKVTYTGPGVNKCSGTIMGTRKSHNYECKSSWLSLTNIALTLSTQWDSISDLTRPFY